MAIRKNQKTKQKRKKKFEKYKNYILTSLEKLNAKYFAWITDHSKFEFHEEFKSRCVQL